MSTSRGDVSWQASVGVPAVRVEYRSRGGVRWDVVRLDGTLIVALGPGVKRLDHGVKERVLGPTFWVDVDTVQWV